MVFFRRISALKVTAAAALTASGIAFFKYRDHPLTPLPFKALKALEANDANGSKWDFNWDKRNPEDVVRKPASSSPEDMAAYKEKLAAATPTAKRMLILVRHGQYVMTGSQDSERMLTALGREQADITGKRLAEIRQNYKNITNVSLTMSTMTRATETARIILQHFSDIPYQSCDLIREGAPCEPVPNVLNGVWDPDPHVIFMQDISQDYLFADPAFFL